MESDLLPSGFKNLESLVEEWVLPDSAARGDMRQSCSIDTLRSYYDAMLPLAPKALDHLQQCKLGDMQAEDERLLKLMLALAEISPAVEWYDSPKVYDGFDIGRVRLVRQIADSAAQQ